MRAVSHVLRRVTVSRGSLCPVLSLSARAQSFRAAGAAGDSDETFPHDVAEDGSGASPPPQQRERYRRRSSDPQTLREREEFRRDRKYGRARPLPDAPWRSSPARTYLDDAERLYGRKETWHLQTDPALRERLVATLRDYIRDADAAARVEIRDARKYRRLCRQRAAAHRSVVAAEALSSYSAAAMGRGGGGSGGFVLEWASEVARTAAERKAGKRTDVDAEAAADDDWSDSATGAGADKPDAPPSSSSSSPDEDEQTRRRRVRGLAEAGSVAMDGVPEADLRAAPVSAFPFLRRRAVEDGASLDPSLVDWTAKYFPGDTADTFREPPTLRRAGDGDKKEADGGAEDAGGEAAAVSAAADSTRLFKGPRPQPRRRLQRSLREHDNAQRATFDADGVFYHVRRPSEAGGDDGDERAPRPRQVRGEEAVGRAGDVVKVPWDVVAGARRQGYDSDTLRARERLTRLTRGEDPRSIP